MPGVAGPNPILNKLAKRGLAKSTVAHAADETEYGSGGDLPAGVNGIAQLVECRFGEYKKGDNAGEAFIYIAGIVKTPSEHAGMRTSRMIPLLDDPKEWENGKTFDERVAEAQNEFRKLGGEEITASMRTEADWVTVMNSLQEAAPHFRFHTFATSAPKNATEKQKKEFRPKTVHVFDRAVTDFQDNGDTSGAVTDNTATSSNGDGGSSSDEPDWNALAQLADSGDGSGEAAEATQKIAAACKAVGVDSDAAENWVQAVEQMLAAQGGEAGSEGQADDAIEPWKPEVGEEYPFKIRGGKKAEDHVVSHVFKSTVNLKRKSDGRVEKGVAWTSDPPALGGQQI